MYLRSRTRHIQVFTVPHETCSTLRCTCKKESVAIATRAADGRLSYREEVRLVPSSMTVLPGSVVEIPDSWAHFADIASAIARRDLVVELSTTVSTPSATAALPTSASHQPHVKRAAKREE